MPGSGSVGGESGCQKLDAAPGNNVASALVADPGTAGKRCGGCSLVPDCVADPDTVGKRYWQFVPVCEFAAGPGMAGTPWCQCYHIYGQEGRAGIQCQGYFEREELQAEEGGMNSQCRYIGWFPD